MVRHLETLSYYLSCLFCKRDNKIEYGRSLWEGLAGRSGVCWLHDCPRQPLDQ